MHRNAVYSYCFGKHISTFLILYADILHIIKVDVIVILTDNLIIYTNIGMCMMQNFIILIAFLQLVVADMLFVHSNCRGVFILFYVSV